MLADALRRQILDGALTPGARLREVELAAIYDVSRHTLRTALRQLASEGLVELQPRRGARVATLDPEELFGLFELRTALEMEAAHLAVERGNGRLPDTVHRALDRLVTASGRARPSWTAVADAHARLHGAIVAASESPRIIAAYTALAAEMQLFLLHLRAVWPLERMGPHHRKLVDALEAGDLEALRVHIAEGRDAVLGEARGPETSVSHEVPVTSWGHCP